MEGLITAFAGGLVIGLAAAILLWSIGRIAGISGIFFEAFRAPGFERVWRVAFVLGLILGPWIVLQMGMHEAPAKNDASWPVLVVAGLLVGFGTRLGAGCTSGHGICGIARFSTRSIVATLLFMSIGFVTVFVTRHVLA